MQTMARVCTPARCCPSSLLTSSTGRPAVQLRSYTEIRGSKRRSRASCTPSVVARSCWLGEQRRWCAVSRRYSGSKGVGRGKRVQVRASIEELSHNHVLISCLVASILGQLVKPTTSALFGKGFNWKLVLKPGGMPSTHSASVTAAATALGMERGLSDSLFGFSVILASLVMYDAQGVRRSVGQQAEVINAIVFSKMADFVPFSSAAATPASQNPSPYAIGVELARDPVQAELSFMAEADSSTTQSSSSTAVLSMENSPRLNGTPIQLTRLAEEQSQLNGANGRAHVLLEAAKKLPSVEEGQVTLQEIGSLDGWRHIPLKESVGHSKFEVFVGALWGIFVALAVHSTTQ